MPLIRTKLWGGLEMWNATAFLVASGLLFVTAAINAVDAFTPVQTQEGVLLTIEGATGFGGVVLFFVGFVALYPRMSDRSPRVAKAGLVLATGPGIFFVSLLVVCSGLATLLGLPSLKVLIPSFGLITAILLGSFATAVTLFGVCGLHTTNNSEPIGGLLLLAAVAWFGLFGGMVIFRYQTPTWMTFLQTALLATSAGAIGFRLRTAVTVAGRDEVPADLTV